MAYGTLTTVTYYLSLFNFSDKGGAQNYSDDDDDDQPGGSGMPNTGMPPPIPPMPPMGMGMHGMPPMGMMPPPGKWHTQLTIETQNRLSLVF